MIARMAHLVPNDCCDNLAAQASPNGPPVHPVDSAIFSEWHTCNCGQQVKIEFQTAIYRDNNDKEIVEHAALRIVGVRPCLRT